MSCHIIGQMASVCVCGDRLILIKEQETQGTGTCTCNNWQIIMQGLFIQTVNRAHAPGETVKRIQSEKKLQKDYKLAQILKKQELQHKIQHKTGNMTVCILHD